MIDPFEGFLKPSTERCDPGVEIYMPQSKSSPLVVTLCMNFAMLFAICLAGGRGLYLLTKHPHSPVRQQLT